MLLLLLFRLLFQVVVFLVSSNGLAIRSEGKPASDVVTWGGAGTVLHACLDASFTNEAPLLVVPTHRTSTAPPAGNGPTSFGASNGDGVAGSGGDAEDVSSTEEGLAVVLKAALQVLQPVSAWAVAVSLGRTEKAGDAITVPGCSAWSAVAWEAAAAACGLSVLKE